MKARKLKSTKSESKKLFVMSTISGDISLTVCQVWKSAPAGDLSRNGKGKRKKVKGAKGKKKDSIMGKGLEVDSKLWKKMITFN